jgi:hypothetical protein
MNPLPEEQSHERYARQLVAEGKTTEEIQELLLQRTGNPEFSYTLSQLLKKEKHDRHMKTGKTKIVIALLLLGTSFVVACLNFHSNVSFTFVLYNFSIAGILLLLWGGYDILH